ncbi:MAG: hypothetical protein RLZZ546_2108 [Bacteroidota bacterium]|jgi:biopolymer transport protein ExbD
MLKRKNVHRLPNEINAGSMADIAFLLLIFFLVSTQISDEKGLNVKLPRWSDEASKNVIIDPRNLLVIHLDENNQVKIKNEVIEINSIKAIAQDFIKNENRDPLQSVSPLKAVISIKSDGNSSYERYTQVYNQLLAAYNEIRNSISLSKYKEGFATLEENQKNEIRQMIPILISDADQDTTFIK